VGFRDRAPEIEARGAVILGASFDPPERNRAFAEKNAFAFPLLSDVDRAVGRAYEVVRHPIERFPDNAKRRTYLIDPEGVIRCAYRVRDIPAHPQEVIDDLDRLGATVDR